MAKPVRKKKAKTSKLSSEELREKLKVKHLETKKAFSEKYPEVEKFLLEKGVEVGKVRSHSAKIIGAGALTGALLLSPPSGVKPLPSPHEVTQKAEDTKAAKAVSPKPPKEVLVETFDEFLPETTRPLSREEEKFLEKVIQNLTGTPARASLEGEHLNTTYGRIGVEQHLRRFPGDTLAEHGEGEILEEGIAPGLGAWGYFVPSRDKLTPELEETERWYAVVQTLYLPDWNTRQPYLRNWYKYRKVLIVNTQNGNAVVAAIADSGPAAWTGKHFGGSPEVMHYLGGSRYKKGPVILFFVDDPENKIPLGPVDYNRIDLPKLAVHEL
jgi:hypothetical protein